MRHIAGADYGGNFANDERSKGVFFRFASPPSKVYIDRCTKNFRFTKHFAASSCVALLMLPICFGIFTLHALHEVVYIYSTTLIWYRSRVLCLLSIQYPSSREKLLLSAIFAIANERTSKWYL